MNPPSFQRPDQLVIATSTPHYIWDEKLWAYGPYSKEIDILSPLFSKIKVLAPLYHCKPPKTYLTYNSNITAHPLPSVGGKKLRNKILNILNLPRTIIQMKRHIRNNDALMARCPSSYGLVATIIGPLLTPYRIAKYAGQWNGYSAEPLTVKLQRMVLSSRWWGAPTTVYGKWPNQPPHIEPFFTSMMDKVQMDTAIASFEEKQKHNYLLRQNNRPLHILFSGRLAPEKNIDVLLNALSNIHRLGIHFECRIVGEGPLETELKKQTSDLHLENRVEFINGLPYSECLAQNNWADCLILPSQHSEGWPKVIAEAMAYGVICIGVDHGQVAQMLKNGGICLKQGNVEEISNAITDLANHPEDYLKHQKKASEWSRQYTIEHLRQKNADLMDFWWNKNNE